jgi:Mg2+ and Co2+ transporter CorA
MRRIPGDGYREEVTSRVRVEQEEQTRDDLRNTVYRIFSDTLMIFLAVLLVPIVLLPLVVDLPEQVVDFLNIADTAIIGVFVIEYLVKLGLADDKVAHFLNRWHLLDLLIITLPLLEILPIQGAQLARTSPILRLLRVLRVVAVGGRSVERQVELEPAAAAYTPRESTMRIRAIAGTLENPATDLAGAGIEAFLRDPEPAWLDISGVSEVDYGNVSKVLDVPEVLIESNLVRGAYPRIDQVDDLTLIFLQNPELVETRRGRTRLLTVRRAGLVVLTSKGKLVTISQPLDGFFSLILNRARRQKQIPGPLDFAVLFSILDHITEQYKAIVGDLEAELLGLENIPEGGTPRNFLEVTFQMRREVNRLVSSLFHLKEVITVIVSKGGPFFGLDRKQKGILDAILAETIYVHESAENLLENVMALIDLHINTTSYQMNRVMKVIAIITTITLIPTTIGQMLGMNILDAPWPLFLWQIVTITLLAMLSVAYIFYKLGWLTS